MRRPALEERPGFYRDGIGAWRCATCRQLEPCHGHRPPVAPPIHPLVASTPHSWWVDLARDEFDAAVKRCQRARDLATPAYGRGEDL